MYAYCENNAVNLADYSGCSVISIGSWLGKLVVGAIKKQHQQLQDSWHIKR